MNTTNNLYELTHTGYSTDELYQYEYDPVGNRLQQIINGDTTTYLYDAANRLAQVDGQAYTFDANGNLLTTGALTNTWDAANRLTSANRNGAVVQPIYNGVGDRVGQIVDGVRTDFALDVVGLPEVIYTSEGNTYLHLPGVIVTENNSGDTLYLLADGLGSIRQAVEANGAVVAYDEFDPYGNPIQNPKSKIQNRYGFTGEWWEDEVGLLHLRARWYLPEDGVFLSRDPVESEPPYQYVWGNPINYTDPTGLQPPPCTGDPTQICITQPVGPDTDEYPPQPLPPTAPPPPPAPKSYPTIGPLEVATCMVTDLFEGPGYAEGVVSTISIGFNVANTKGKEVVYDFATMERGVFNFNETALFDPNLVPPTPGFTTAGLEIARMVYDVQLKGFNSEKNLRREYEGYFVGHTIGVGSPVKIKGIPGTDKVVVGVGKIYVDSPEVYGAGDYIMSGLGVSPLPILAISLSATDYTLESKHSYGTAGFISDRQIRQIKDDIQSGVDSPWPPTGPNWYTRQRAINELDEIWKKHQYFFEFRYSGYH